MAVLFMKRVIEGNDGYRLFWNDKGEPIKRLQDLKAIYRLTWFGRLSKRHTSELSP